MAIIKIYRKKEFNNMFRNYQIFIDEQNVGTLANGEVKEFEILEGEHYIKAEIDWCGSPKVIVKVNENETNELKIGGFKNANLFIVSTFFILITHFILLNTLNFGYTILLVIPTFLVPFYYLTFGRNQYLRINQIKNYRTS